MLYKAGNGKGHDIVRLIKALKILCYHSFKHKHTHEQTSQTPRLQTTKFNTERF